MGATMGGSSGNTGLGVSQKRGSLPSVVDESISEPELASVDIKDLKKDLVKNKKRLINYENRAKTVALKLVESTDGITNDISTVKKDEDKVNKHIGVANCQIKELLRFIEYQEKKNKAAKKGAQTIDTDATTTISSLKGKTNLRKSMGSMDEFLDHLPMPWTETSKDEDGKSTSGKRSAKSSRERNKFFNSTSTSRLNKTQTKGKSKSNLRIKAKIVANKSMKTKKTS